MRKHTGVAHDWSERQIVFSRAALAQHPELFSGEPRVLNQAIERWQVPNWGAFHAAHPLAVSQKAPRIQRDWNVTGLGATLRENMFPAKFSFDPSLPPDCTNDYVVIGLAVAGATGGQANLVAFNNLYVDSNGKGVCSGTEPNVLFAYNVSTVGGKILTSPVLSEDGTQIAFVESVPGATPSATFHVLTWTAGGVGGNGTIGNAAAPVSMTSLTFSTVANCSLSSPWVDYSTYTAYVGDDDGNLYQITGVFHGTPTLSGSPWPVAVSPNYSLTAPVLDWVRGFVMVGSANGALYQINSTTGVPKHLQIGESGSISGGLYTPPIVDVANGITFVLSANVGHSGVLEEVKTNALVALSTAHIGLGNADGADIHFYQPAFSNDYYSEPSTGIITVCGTGLDDTTPWQYEFGFSAATPPVMKESAETGYPIQLSTSTTDTCTGWTEFYNPNINSGVDFFFFGLSGDCTLFGPFSTGCVTALSSDSTIPTVAVGVADGPSGIIVDNYSTAADASNIYLTSLAADIIYKFTQDLLQ